MITPLSTRPTPPPTPKTELTVPMPRPIISAGNSSRMIPNDSGKTAAPAPWRTRKKTSDGRLQASDLEAALSDRSKEAKDVTHSLPVRIAAHYVEMGRDRRGGGTYVLRYKWEGGGLFGERSLHLAGLSR